MEPFEQNIDDQNSGVKVSAGWRRLGAGGTALLLAATIAACGGSDSSDTTSAADTTAAAQTETTAEATAETTEAAAANGVVDMSAEEILAAATDAARSATAVHVSGGGGGTELDLSLVRDEGASGRITQDGNSFEVIAVGDAVYLKGDDIGRSVGAEVAARLPDGKWLKVPAGTRGFEGVEGFTNMDALLAKALSPPRDGISKGKVETVDGTEVIGLGDSMGTLYVATTGDPLPVGFVNPRQGGGISFDGWNESVELTAPAGAVDLG